jgi:hypothetical protein
MAQAMAAMARHGAGLLAPPSSGASHSAVLAVTSG